MAKVKKVKDKQKAKMKLRKQSKFVLEAIKNVEGIPYICTKCWSLQGIPVEMVMYLDTAELSDLRIPPMFNCEKCGNLMEPIFYESVHGYVHEYKNK